MGFYEFPPDSLVVVTSPKTIVKEWRFVVANGRVVAGCQYKEGDTFDYRPDYDAAAFDLAGSVASVEYEPDPVWVIDICQTADKSYHVLEVGGFGFADLYACNKADVVAAVSAVATGVWQEGRG